MEIRSLIFILIIFVIGTCSSSAFHIQYKIIKLSVIQTNSLIRTICNRYWSKAIWISYVGCATGVVVIQCGCTARMFGTSHNIHCQMISFMLGT